MVASVLCIVFSIVCELVDSMNSTLFSWCRLRHGCLCIVFSIVCESVDSMNSTLFSWCRLRHGCLCPLHIIQATRFLEGWQWWWWWIMVDPSLIHAYAFYFQSHILYAWNSLVNNDWCFANTCLWPSFMTFIYALHFCVCLMLCGCI